MDSPIAPCEKAKHIKAMLCDDWTDQDRRNAAAVLTNTTQHGNE